ncbi:MULTISPECIES: XRE family transcriptional regulator [Streptomyces]|uniref:helix-turn-helix domain-containing protein n=1 Tax=Streptomyces TaxID=1883 RepID=UPI00240DE4A4|nr:MULTISPECIES: XRE family transcriptional regulator [Streptomyces]WFB87811.1 XRE family transcriptional regulator [Streptomyces olivaceus]WGK47412.1 XRE family transcriptional regulator [Streptomyces sp. B146]
MTTEHTRLVAALRELKAGSGLSLAALAERTPYSKSSWERYLNGKSLPPRQAVRDLCRLANEPDGRLLALWEIAESRWSGRATPPAPALPTLSTDEPPQSPPQQAPPPTGAGRRRARGRLLLALASAYTVIVGGAAALLFLLLPDSEAREDEPPTASVPFSLGPQCQGAACEGRDPMRLICGIGPDTLASHRTATGAHVELRHSTKCGASWVRTWGTEIGDRVDVTAGGPTHDVRIRNEEDAAAFVYTEMTEVGPGSTVRACFRPAAPDGERECFEARVDGPATTTEPPSSPAGSSPRA